MVFEDLEKDFGVDAEGDQILDDLGSIPASFGGHGIDRTDRITGPKLEALVRFSGFAVDHASEGKQEVRAPVADVPQDFAFRQMHLLYVACEIGDGVDPAGSE